MTIKSGEPSDTPFARAVGNGKSYWDWIEQPENAVLQRRFNISMSGIQSLTTSAPVLSGNQQGRYRCTHENSLKSSI